MADSDGSDIIMMFVYKGRPILGESQTAISPPGAKPNRIMTGFQPGSIIEIETFTFALGVQDLMSNAAAAQGMPPAPGQPANMPGTPRQPGVGRRWAGGSSKTKYPISVQPISFTRAIDRSSTTLLDFCINSVTLDSATLVKRKAAGGKVAGEPYLRLDFTGVLITNVSWTSGDPVKETTKFISRAITVRYRPQLPDGSLGAPRHGFWSMNPWARESAI